CHLQVPKIIRFFSFLTFIFIQVSYSQVYRINCGGPQYTDTQGNVWFADGQYNQGGTIATFPGATFQNTQDDELYRTERYGVMTYAFPAIGNLPVIVLNDLQPEQFTMLSCCLQKVGQKLQHLVLEFSMLQSKDNLS